MACPEFEPDEPIDDRDRPTLPLRAEINETTKAIGQMKVQLSEVQGTMENRLSKSKELVDLVESRFRTAIDFAVQATLRRTGLSVTSVTDREDQDDGDEGYCHMIQDDQDDQDNARRRRAAKDARGKARAETTPHTPHRNPLAAKTPWTKRILSRKRAGSREPTSRQPTLSARPPPFPKRPQRGELRHSRHRPPKASS